MARYALKQGEIAKAVRSFLRSRWRMTNDERRMTNALVFVPRRLFRKTAGELLEFWFVVG
jgi:hypothetical protein